MVLGRPHRSRFATFDFFDFLFFFEGTGESDSEEESSEDSLDDSLEVSDSSEDDASAFFDFRFDERDSITASFVLRILGDIGPSKLVLAVAERELRRFPDAFAFFEARFEGGTCSGAAAVADLVPSSSMVREQGAGGDWIAAELDAQ